MKKLLLPLFLLMGLSVAHADVKSYNLFYSTNDESKGQWFDLTDDYIVNPRFDGNDRWTGWEGTTYGAYEPDENVEFYQTTFDTYQVITGLKPGRYRVGVQAYQRIGLPDYDEQMYQEGDLGCAVLYANSSEQNNNEHLALLASGATSTIIGGRTLVTSRGFVPDNMVAAAAWFKAGYYHNYVDVTVGSDGVLKIGVKTNTPYIMQSYWVCLDNWTLEYLVEESNSELVDLTDDYIVNPRFDGNDRWTGWEGTTYGAYEPDENVEFYQTTFDTYQVITGLKPGRYRVGVQAYQRIGLPDYDEQMYQEGDLGCAVLYANSSEQNNSEHLALLASGATSTIIGGRTLVTSRGYVPDNMVAAAAWFKAGYYHNYVDVTVGSDGVLKIGVKTNTPYIMQSYWVCLDNWTLEMYAENGSSEWIDMTDNYVTNPRFDGNNIYWGWSGDEFGAYNGKENAEHYNRTFDSYQTITGLAPGRYKVSVQAFYRAGSIMQDIDIWNDNPNYGKRAFLYAYSSNDEQETAICQAASGMIPEHDGRPGSLAWNGEGYIPDNMEAADSWFKEGAYNNSIEVTVGSDGILTIGIRKVTRLDTDWVCLDNWKLEYLSTASGIVHAESVSLDCDKIEIGYKEVFKLNATVLPQNAIVRRVEWTSSNPAVAIVDNDGNVIGRGVGTTIITATTKDGGFTAECEVTVTVNSPVAGSIIVNEIMVANVDMFIDPSWNYGGWIELYNPTNSTVNMGNCWISDDPADLMKAHMNMDVGSVPARGFLNLWFDHTGTRKDIGEGWVNTQLDIELDMDGGSLYISDPQGNLICEVSYPASLKRTSYARTSDGGNDWGYTAYPTPAASNASSKFAVEQLAMPMVDKDGQVFAGSLDVKVEIPSGTKLIYTTDGSTPTESNGYVSQDGMFMVNSTSSYRFRLFQDGKLPSDVVTRTYIYNDRGYYLPIVSVVTDSRNLYDDEIGVYVTGTNGKTANQDWVKRNFNMDWDRPVNFEYMVDGQEVYNQETALSISGGWSRKYEPRSFKLKAKKEYGLKDLQYPFFSDKMYNKTKSLLFRNGGNDNYNLFRMKDASLQAIARESQFRLNLQSYQPTHIFINGEYYAMLNMREPSNKHYGYSNYGIGTDDIDAFEMSVDSGYVQKDGTRDAFEQWYKLAENSTDPMIYQQICDIVDIDDYCNYMAFKFFLNDWDWPHNNMKAFKGRTDGKFHFVIFDLDNCVDRVGNNIFYDFENAKIKTFYSRPEYNNTSITAEVEMVTIFLNMIENEEFKKKFIDTYCMVGGSVFADEEKNAEIVNSLAANIETALGWERGFSPFGYYKEQAGGIINAFSGGFKERMIDVIKSYERFSLGDVEIQPTVIASNVEEAKILLNGMEIPKNTFNGYTFAPVTLKAETPAGYKFKGWSVLSTEDMFDTNELLAKGNNWKFYDEGEVDENWKGESYSESGWKSAPAPFGFAKAGKPMAEAATEVGTSDNRPLTAYFRQEIDLDYEPTSDTKFTMNISVDDGYIAYVNGHEVAKYHLYSDADYYTLTQDLNDSWYEADLPHEETVTIDGSLLHMGKNVIAIEVHQCTSHSSDFWFDASLTEITSLDAGFVIVSTEPTYTLPTSGSLNVTAMFEPADAATLVENRVNPVKINEVSASNDVNVNEFYKKNDWLELYNTTDNDIDVAGMYISDNVDKPHKYQFVKTDGVNTVIPAHGHLVVWCDKLEAQSQIHTSFKLAAEGGTLVISAEDDSWMDQFNYCEHKGNESVGLYPDGGTMCYIMHRPTIGKTNAMTSYDAKYEQVFAPEFAHEDVNQDGTVDTQDILAIYQFMQDAGTVTAKTREDLNRDGVVDTQDVLNLYDYIQNH